jgi:hypothetical protein
MISQLVQRMADSAIFGPDPVAAVAPARDAVLQADPLDLVLHMAQVWDSFAGPPAPSPLGPTARRTLADTNGQFRQFSPPPGNRAWDHLGYSYVLENSRAVQIIKRVVRAFRLSEAIGIATGPTLKWLDVTEAMLFTASNPFAAWLSTTPLGLDSESVRRNAYWRLFGLDLAFGTDDNRPPDYEKAAAANTTFVGIFEELLFELWQAMTNVRNIAGVNTGDDDRIFRLAEALAYMLRSRRQGELQATNLAREELAAATVLGWIDLTLSADTPVIVDTGSVGSNPANRLANLGAKVGLLAHSKSSALFSMAAELSKMLRVIEAGIVSDPQYSWVFYREQPVGPIPPGYTGKPIGEETRRVITEWSAATGRDLKARSRPVETSGRRLVSVQ